MQPKILVSVVMPAYNAQNYIAATLKSVMEQTFRDFELIVVDDCSTDGTREIVQQASQQDARIRLIKLPKNRGAPAGPRNVGIQASVGAWIAFLDADDIWHPQKLACQMQALTLSGATFCSTQMCDFEDEKDLVFTDPADFKVEKIGFLKQLIKFRTPTSSVIVRKDLVTLHPFNEDMRFKAREDLDCWLHCHEEIGESIKVRHPLVGYRIIRGQISGKKWQMIRRHCDVLRQYRLRSGRSLGLGAYLFTLSHFSFALYYRLLKKGL